MSLHVEIAGKYIQRWTIEVVFDERNIIQTHERMNDERLST